MEIADILEYEALFGGSSGGGGGGEMTKTLIWENPDPSQAISATLTIPIPANIDISSFKYLEMYAAHARTALNYTGSFLKPVDEMLTSKAYVGKNLNFGGGAVRNLYIESGSLKVSAPSIGTSDGFKSADSAIPLKIYGLK